MAENNKRKTLLSFYSRVSASSSSNVDTSIPSEQPHCVVDTSISSEQPHCVVDTLIPSEQPPSSNANTSIPEEPPSKFQRVDSNDIFVEPDPGLRIPIWKHPVNKRDEFRRAYINMKPSQPSQVFPASKSGKQNRRFQYSWFQKFPWLEYSQAKDAAFCFPCFLFEKNANAHCTLTGEGFKNWKRVNDGDKCVFLMHEGGLNSPHRIAVKSVEDLMNPTRHIDKVIVTQSAEEVQKNRLRLMASIESVRYLALQACAFRGHDESSDSSNPGNFLAMIKFIAKLRNDIADVVLENAPKNAKYTSPDIQKEILHIFGNKIRNRIREEVGDAKFCIMVDEARDESNCEQMAIVLRFVDVDGFIRERFFDIVHVTDTTAATLKTEISRVLGNYNLHIHNMRGQGYDGASNMRGSWNGLQKQFLDDCPYAYYIHCFAHRLQLALVAAAEREFSIWDFFLMLTTIVNLVSASPKRLDELKSAQVIEIENMVATGERETGRGINQIGTLKRAGATRWSSHFYSICSLMDMYGATCTVLKSLSEEGSTNAIRGGAGGALKAMKSFEFIFVLHLMHKIMGITDLLCKALQQKSQDILNAMDLVSTTKELLQTLREHGWDSLIIQVESFCRNNDFDVPDMGARFKEGTDRSCQQQNDFTVEEHYHYNIFNSAIDFQLMELNSRFDGKVVELLILSTALEPRNAFGSFNIEDICTLANKFYPGDFTKQEIHHLRTQLEHFEIDVPHHEKFQNMSTISELCHKLVETNKSKVYHLIDRLLRLVLTLPVSTATTERAFSAMKLIKSTLRNKMGDEFLADSMIVYIEREFVTKIDSDSIIDDFYSIKNRTAQLK